MTNSKTADHVQPVITTVQHTVYPILVAICFTHLLNDVIQATISAIYPLIKNKFQLSFFQIGFVTLSYQLTASFLQPFVGLYTDKYPKPFSVVAGMGFSLLGIVALSWASSYAMILVAVCLIGIGSSIFHPESARVAYLASGGRRGLAQSVFQLGGNSGTAIGPLLVALIVIPFGLKNLAWFALVALLGGVMATIIGQWYQKTAAPKVVRSAPSFHPLVSRNKAIFSLFVLMILVFSKYVYLAGMTSYYTFFLMEKFKLSVQDANVHLFIFSAAVAIGTVAGGPLGDRFGRKYIIWISILGAAPFTLLLPYADLFWTTVLSICIGLIIASAFSAILVFAQELVPGKVGLISGLFYGMMFGMGGIGSALLGNLADMTSITYVFHIIAFLPFIGVITGFLPKLRTS